jgi:hypothetical protein
MKGDYTSEGGISIFMPSQVHQIPGVANYRHLAVVFELISGAKPYK